MASVALNGSVVRESALPYGPGMPMPYFGAWHSYPVEVGRNPVHDTCHAVCGEKRHVVVVKPLSEVVVEPDFPLIPGSSNVVIEVPTDKVSALR